MDKKEDYRIWKNLKILSLFVMKQAITISQNSLYLVQI